MKVDERAYEQPASLLMTVQCTTLTMLWNEVLTLLKKYAKTNITQ